MDDLDLHPEHVARQNLPAEPDTIYPRKERELVTVIPAGHDADSAYLGHRLDNEDTRHDRVVREVTLEERFVLGDVLDADGPNTGFELLDPVHQEEGVAVRDEIPDLRRPEWRIHESISPAVRPSTSFLLKSRNSLVRVPSSPASKISRTPRSSKRSTTATHRTGKIIWFRNASRTSSAVVNNAPSVAPIIGICGACNSTPRRSSSISCAASAMSGEWKPLIPPALLSAHVHA